MTTGLEDYKGKKRKTPKFNKTPTKCANKLINRLRSRLFYDNIILRKLFAAAVGRSLERIISFENGRILAENGSNGGWTRAFWLRIGVLGRRGPEKAEKAKKLPSTEAMVAVKTKWEATPSSTLPRTNLLSPALSSGQRRQSQFPFSLADRQTLNTSV